MAKKRKTKEQREQEQIDALRVRILYIATGAAGYDMDNEEEHFTPEALSRFIPALEVFFLCEEEGKQNKYLFNPRNLDHYENVDSVTEFLFEQGVRA